LQFLHDWKKKNEKKATSGKKKMKGNQQREKDGEEKV
jgi:hypothetical protein